MSGLIWVQTVCKKSLTSDTKFDHVDESPYYVYVSSENSSEIASPKFYELTEIPYPSGVIAILTLLTFSLQAPIFEGVIKTSFSYSSTKTYDVSIQKSRLIQTVLLSTQNIC